MWPRSSMPRVRACAVQLDGVFAVEAAPAGAPPASRLDRLLERSPCRSERSALVLENVQPVGSRSRRCASATAITSPSTVSRCASRRAPSTASSGRTARARRPRCGSCSGCSAPTPARVRVLGRDPWSGRARGARPDRLPARRRGPVPDARPRAPRLLQRPRRVGARAPGESVRALRLSRRRSRPAGARLLEGHAPEARDRAGAPARPRAGRAGQADRGARPARAGRVRGHARRAAATTVAPRSCRRTCCPEVERCATGPRSSGPVGSCSTGRRGAARQPAATGDGAGRRAAAGAAGCELSGPVRAAPSTRTAVPGRTAAAPWRRSGRTTCGSRSRGSTTSSGTCTRRRPDRAPADRRAPGAAAADPGRRAGVRVRAGRRVRGRRRRHARLQRVRERGDRVPPARARSARGLGVARSGASDLPRAVGAVRGLASASARWPASSRPARSS